MICGKKNCLNWLLSQTQYPGGLWGGEILELEEDCDYYPQFIWVGGGEWLAGDEGEIKSSEDDDDKLLLTFQCMDLTTPVKDISIILTYCL